MLYGLCVLFMAIGMAEVHCGRLVGGWSPTGEGDSQTEMLHLAREQLNASGDFSSSEIEVISFETQIVAGTNLRLVFLVDDTQKCTMTAFKPLPYRKEPTTVQSFTCEDVTPTSNWVNYLSMRTWKYFFWIKTYFFWQMAKGSLLSLVGFTPQSSSLCRR